MLTKKRWLLLLIILLAFGLRVYRLDAQSIWYDEGLSIQLAGQDPVQTIALSATTDHPPLHALLLGAWMRMAGSSDFVVRYLSVFCGVLVVVLTYLLGNQYDQRAGLIAAGFISIAPLAVYYSQETRGYMLLTAMILIATIAAVRLLNGDSRRRIWLAYLAAMVLALYTHYFAAFAWVAIVVGFTIGLISNPHPRACAQPLPTREKESAVPLSLKGRGQGEGRLRLFGFWIAAQFVILACFLPWVPNALAQAGSNATYFPGRVTWQTVFGDTWRAFSVGEGGDVTLLGWLWLGLIALGAASGLRKLAQARKEKTLWSSGSVVVLSVSLIIIPLLLMSGLAWLKPKFAPRYLLPSLPAFVTLAAAGFTFLVDGMRTRYRRWASIGVVIALALPLASIGSLVRLYYDPALARPDVRAVVHYIEDSEQPSDAILLIGGHQAPAFNHYYHGQATVIPLPPDLLPAAQSPLDAHALQQLKSIVQAHPRLWLVQWQSQISDPTDVIASTLLNTAKRIKVGENFHDMSVLFFDVLGAQIPDGPQHAMDAQFVEPIRAVGYNVDSRRIPIDTPLRFGLYLQAEDVITGNYQIFTHLVAADGTLIAQADHIAGADSYPTSLWRPQSLLYNQFEMAVPADTPPGEYRVVVGLYDEHGRLKLKDGRDQIDLFTIILTPSS